MADPRTFAWTETGAVLRALLAEHGDALELDDRGRSYVAPGVRFVAPDAVPLRGRDPESYLRAFPAALGRQLIVLLQAGAAALGRWHDDELVEHKVFKRYVVRGHGRAQPARLRLQNARALLVDVAERLVEWEHRHGPADLVLYACPVRQWGELFAATPPPPFDRDAAIKIGHHVHGPGFDELQRVRRLTLRGRVEVEPR